MVSGMVCELFLNKATEKECLGAVRMTQWIKAPGTKPDDLSSIPKTQISREKTPPELSFDRTNVCRKPLVADGVRPLVLELQIVLRSKI